MSIITQDEVIKILKKAGWVETSRGKVSHKIFTDPETKRVTTVPKDKKDLSKGTLGAI
ncbi:MAG: type II toxin-antitoxin system HicA family toxin [Synergistaceae bacterium]|nr:type II toxin-antitoxin system HicA family toxin [Synergistaceae bacterium]